MAFLISFSGKLCSREWEKNRYTSANESANPPPTHFPHAGLKQQYSQPLSHPLDVSLYTEDQLAYDASSQTYPVIIVIESIGASLNPSDAA